MLLLCHLLILLHFTFVLLVCHCLSSCNRLSWWCGYMLFLLTQNPQSDLQAQDRCHRIGQNRPVVVYRLITANTVDQKIVERANAKRKLEKLVIHKGHNMLFVLADVLSLLSAIDSYFYISHLLNYYICTMCVGILHSFVWLHVIICW